MLSCIKQKFANGFYVLGMVSSRKFWPTWYDRYALGFWQRILSEKWGQKILWFCDSLEWEMQKENSVILWFACPWNINIVGVSNWKKDWKLIGLDVFSKVLNNYEIWCSGICRRANGAKYNWSIKKYHFARVLSWFDEVKMRMGRCSDLNEEYSKQNGW